MALKNKLINHIDKIKEIVLENELLKYAVKSLQKKLEEKNREIQHHHNTLNKEKMNQKKIVHFNTHNNEKLKEKKQWWIKQKNNDNLNFKPSSQQFQRRNIGNFVKNVQSSLESSQRQPPKQSHPKIFIILKRKKFI